MQILDNLIIVSLIVLGFIAGMKVDAHYHMKASISTKEALEKQFLRLRVKADADDPCKPYVAPRAFSVPLSQPKPTGDYDGDTLIPQSFMDELKANGKAKTTLRKSNVTK